MLEIAAGLLPLLDAGASVVVATAVGVDGRMPRTLGTSMAWDGTAAIGSIAGGCIEGAIVEVADRVLDDARTRVIEFGVSDGDAFRVGLACGGRIRLHLALLTPGSPVVPALRDAVTGRAAAVAFTEAGFAVSSDTGSDLGDPVVVDPVVVDPVFVDPVFVDRVEPPARMIVTGAMDFTAALSSAAQVLGYRVTVVDPRELFATPDRFPGAEIVVAWPPTYLAATAIDPRTVICHLAHDDRYDTDLLQVALASPAGYVGALGSRPTTQKRQAALEARGVDTARLHAPIGLDLGATSPAEVAVSILAEVLSVRSGRLPDPLRATSGALRPHRS